MYENIRPILSNENSGFPGKGRNEGIKNATSEFIMFMDNDDEYDKDICKNLYEELISQNCDLVACNYLNIDDINEIKSNHKYYFGNEKENKVVFYDENTIYLTCWLVWACIFRKEIILKNNIQFPEDSLSEDVYFLSIYNLYAKKTIYLKEYIGINRYIQNDSHSKSLTTHKIDGQLNNLESILDKYDKINCNLSLIYGGVADIILFNIYRTNAINEPKNQVYHILKRYKNYKERINYKNSKGFLFKIADKLIFKNHFYLARKYLMFLHFIYGLDFMISIYRFFN